MKVMESAERKPLPKSCEYVGVTSNCRLSHPSTLTRMNSPESTFQNQEQKEVENMEVRSIGDGSGGFGVDYLGTVACTNTLALALWEKGRAEGLHIQGVEMGKRVYGVDHPTRLTSVHNLASTLLSQGRLRNYQFRRSSVLLIFASPPTYNGEIQPRLSVDGCAHRRCVHLGCHRGSSDIHVIYNRWGY